MSEVVYVVHPVSAELKAKLRKEGKKIVDANYAPEGAKVVDPHKAKGKQSAAQPEPEPQQE